MSIAFFQDIIESVESLSIEDQDSKYRTKSLKSRREWGFMRNSTNLETPMNQYNALKQALKP
ncbi:MAG: hypothetical protein EWV63_10510, partial [Microcystis aeruginosa Ma_OC_H_19870700_S124]